MSEDLGIRYVLEGSVRRSGDQVRINAQLVDATTGGHLWADRYDGMAKDIFALQDRVTEQIVNALSVKLIDDSDSESDREKFGTQNTDAHDAYLQGLSFYLRNTPADNARSESFFLRAVELDPDFKRAYAALAKVYYKASSKEYALALGMYSRKAIFLAHINLIKTEGADMADVHVVRSQMALDKHQVGIALTEAASALKLNPNHIDALKAKSKALIYLGQYPEGREIAESIIRLDPAAPAEPLFLIGLSEFALGRYAPASEYIERAIKSDPTTATYFGVLAASLGKSGQTEKAGSAWDSYREFWNRIERPIWIAAAVYPHPFEQREVLQNLAEGLRNAGAAERPPSLYLKLDKDNRLEGTEIRALLFGKTIRGEDYWRKTLWSQSRSLEGEVIHTGEPIHIVGYQYDHDEKTAKSWIDDNRLCMQWAVQSTPLTICEQVYRDSDSDRETYYLVTDMGPHPFHIVE